MPTCSSSAAGAAVISHRSCSAARAIGWSTMLRATCSSCAIKRREHEGTGSDDHQSGHHDTLHPAQGGGASHGEAQGERSARREEREGGRHGHRGRLPPPGGESRPAVPVQPARRPLRRSAGLASQRREGRPGDDRAGAHGGAGRVAERSRADVVNAFTKPDDVIEDEIREDIIRRLLFLTPEAIDVSVSQGIVTLSGELETRTEAHLLEELTRRLDGVIRVDSHLTFEVDDQRIEKMYPLS